MRIIAALKITGCIAAVVTVASCAGQGAVPTAGSGVAALMQPHAPKCKFKRQLLKFADHSFVGDVAATQTDAWVGGNASYGKIPFAFHFHKKRWQYLKLLARSAVANDVQGLAATSTTSAWAVGGYLDSNSHGQPFAQRWNGVKWGNVKLPAAGASGGYLHRIVAMSDRDAWAVGGAYNAVNAFAPVALHWDGKKWKLTGAAFKPMLAGNAAFSTRIVEGSNSVGAGIAEYKTGTQIVAKYAELTLGKSTWSDVTVPSHGYAQNYVNAVLPSSKGLFMIGYGENSVSSPPHPMVQLYNGKSFALQPFPNVMAALLDGASSGDGGAIAVGAKFVSPMQLYTAAFLFWNGKWYDLPTPKTAGSYTSVAPITGTWSYWAAGNGPSPNGQPFVDRIDCPVM